MMTDSSTTASTGVPEVARSSKEHERPSLLSNLTEQLEITTRRIQKQLGSVNDLTSEVFFFGDGIQRAATDRFFDLLRPAAWSPAGLWRMSSNALSELFQLARFFTPGETSYLSWLEARNTFEVFMLVRNVPSILNLSPENPEPLCALINRAYQLSPFATLWAVEGLGHYYTDNTWNRHGPPQGLFSNEATDVPDKALLMLHAGMGLAFAYRSLSDVVTQSPVSQFRRTVARFVALCRENSRPGYLGAAVESLGLVARDFYPDMVRNVAQALQETAPELVGFFWHGVGRALYFSPTYFLPILRAPWSAVQAEGATDLERLNLMAGLTWAVTLVNMRHPPILENVLRDYIQRSILKDGFANGVSSSIVMRRSTTPEAQFVDEFCAYQPACAHKDSASLWKTLITIPCQEACQSYAELAKNHSLDRVFQYRTAAGKELNELATNPDGSGVRFTARS